MKGKLPQKVHPRDQIMSKMAPGQVLTEKSPDGNTKRTISIKEKAFGFVAAEITQSISGKAFRNLDNDDKARVLQAMERNGMSRRQIANEVEISESRISQLIGAKRNKRDIIIEIE